MIPTKNNVFIILFITSIVVIGFLYSVLPHYVRYQTLEEAGERYIVLTVDSPSFEHINVHGARYRDIIDGRFLSGEVDTYEYRDGPSLWPILSAAMLAPFLWLTQSVSQTIIITDFVFPILIFLSFFLIINALTRNKFFSLFSALLLMLFPRLPLYIPPMSLIDLKIIILQFLPAPSGISHNSFKYLVRESFIPGGPFFILSLYFAYKAISTETKRKIFVVLAGVFYGLLFYLYLYFWVFTTIFLGLFFLALLIRKKKTEALSIFAVGVIGFIISIPFWLNYLNLRDLSNYWQLIEKNGIEIGRAFQLGVWKLYLVMAAMVALVVWLGRKFAAMPNFHLPRFDITATFLVTLIAAGAVVFNIQIVTGYNIQSDHWISRVLAITHGVIFSVLFYYLYLVVRERFSVLFNRVRLGKILAILGVVVLLSMTSNLVFNRIVYNAENAWRYTVTPEFLAAYEWLDANTPKDSVVMAPSLDTNMELAVYTHNRIFFARSWNTLAPEKEILNRFYITYKFFEVDPQNVYEFLNTRRGAVILFGSRYFGQDLDVYLGNRPLILSNEVITRVLNEYTFFNVPEIIPYKLDYIFIGPREREIGIDTEWLDAYKKIYDKIGIEIYKVP